MTLISMLLALIIERLAVRSSAWQAHGYLKAYVRFSASSGLGKLASHGLGQYVWLALPGAVVALLLYLADNYLISLVINTLVLLLAMGCWHFRLLYKQYLNAMQRGDEEAGFLAMQQIRHDSGSREQSSYGQVLVWLNFQYYAAVVFWFLVAGAFGVVTYALVRHLKQTEQANVALEGETELELEAATETGTRFASPCLPQGQCISHWLNWFPARLFGLGLALVGHFSRANSTLLSYFLDFTADNEQVITEVATAAEPMVDGAPNSLDESSQMLRLAKRNMLFFLALTSILTLAGWLV